MATETFRHALARGRGFFEGGDYFAAHEAWEEGFHATHGAERLALQALILWAAALHHRDRGNPEGARRLTLRALERAGRIRGMGPLDADALEDALLATLEAVRDGAEVDARAALLAVMEAGDEPEEAGGEVTLDHLVRCPSCAAPVVLTVAPEDALDSSYVEDCPVCCRPLTVVLHEGRLSLGRA